MIVGLLTLDLLLEQSDSLKAKRRIVRSLYDKIRRKFNVSVAEVDHQNLWRRATLAVAYVSTDTRQVNRVLSTIVQFVEGQRTVVLVDYEMEIV